MRFAVSAAIAATAAYAFTPQSAVRAPVARPGHLTRRECGVLAIIDSPKSAADLRQDTLQLQRLVRCVFLSAA